jgi:glutamate--cysteine ligase catalytic subunit
MRVDRLELLRLALVVTLFSNIRAGVLRVGNPLLWERARPHLSLVRTSGVEQFMNHYIRSRDVETPLFLWGDELEYGIFRYDKNRNRFDLSLRGKEIRDMLAEKEKGLSNLPSGCEWQPEYGSWMVEAVPRDPYRGYVSDLLLVEKSMQMRRKRLHSALQDSEIAPSSSTFPMLGVPGYEHSEDCGGQIANSRYLSDRLINPHPRFGALTRNIRSRRQSNVNIVVPKAKEVSKLFAGSIAEAEPSAAINKVNTGTASSSNDACGADVIHMDAMAFGMGCCCLQVTMQARSDHESRFLHDQLAVLAPHLLALSASTPILKGHLADTDTRWSVISMSVDDRTEAERGASSSSSESTSSPPRPDPQLVGNGMRKLSKSRYSSVSLFMGKPSSEEESKNLEALNDVKPEFDEDAYRLLVDGGVDPALALHISHLFVRDPLVIFDDLIEIDNTKATVRDRL